MSQPPEGAPVPSDPMVTAPGSKAWVERHHGPVADFTDRIPPGIVDVLLTGVGALVPMIAGVVLIVSGIPNTYPCGEGLTGTCEVPGSGSGVLVASGFVLVFLSVVAGFAITAWNRVWRVTRTGQSIGKKLFGLKVIDAEAGTVPELGPALLRELVHQFAGIISWLWMLVDGDDRTLADIVAKTHVIQVAKG